MTMGTEKENFVQGPLRLKEEKKGRKNPGMGKWVTGWEKKQSKRYLVIKHR